MRILPHLDAMQGLRYVVLPRAREAEDRWEETVLTLNPGINATVKYNVAFGACRSGLIDVGRGADARVSLPSEEEVDDIWDNTLPCCH
jgi:hypothetical protein